MRSRSRAAQSLLQTTPWNTRPERQSVRASMPRRRMHARRLRSPRRLPKGHMALARLLDSGFFDFTQASKKNGAFAVRVGHIDDGHAYDRSAVLIDLVNPRS